MDPPKHQQQQQQQPQQQQPRETRHVHIHSPVAVDERQHKKRTTTATTTAASTTSSASVDRRRMKGEGNEDAAMDGGATIGGTAQLFDRPGITIEDGDEQPNWMRDQASRDYILKNCTIFYALSLVIFGIIVELSHLIATAEAAESGEHHSGGQSLANWKDLFLAIFFYGGSLIFILFCSTVIVKKQKKQRAAKQSVMYPKDDEQPATLLQQQHHHHRHNDTIDILGSHVNFATGSMYLRLGCVVFGIIGVVYYGLIWIVCLLGWEGHHTECNEKTVIISALAAVFIFVQIWFVFCNAKVEVHGTANLARLGLMHLVATNLWSWMRYIIYEEVETNHEIAKARFLGNTSQSGDDLSETEILNAIEKCKGIHCVFGGTTELMYTCVVEYSLICAGIAFVFWTNVGRRDQLRVSKARMSIIQVDCSRTVVGLFVGFIFLVITIISITLFNAYADRKELAQWIFLSTNFAFFIVAIGICCYAFYRMRVLRFEIEEKIDNEYSAELLDQILLVVGLIGELVYCLGGITAFVALPQQSPLSLLLFFVHCLRLIQVSLQSALISVGSRLTLDEDNRYQLTQKPGKQVITMLLVINCCSFMMNVFEAQKAGVTEEIVRLYGSREWALLVRGTSPLTIFYRFHASACFAEIWKKTYKMPSFKRSDKYVHHRLPADDGPPSQHHANHENSHLELLQIAAAQHVGNSHDRLLPTLATPETDVQ